MLTAPTPLDEAERMRALEHLKVLDSAPEREFDALVATAGLVCGVPIALVSLIDSGRQWFKANIGLPGVTETPRDVAFCAHAILQEEVFEVPDALADPRFADNPLVAGAPDIRFYAGAPLRLSNGAHVGTLCVIDRVPRKLCEKQREALRLLSIAAVQALESRRMARSFVASETRFRTLSEASPLGVFATDASGSCTYTNAQWQAIFGLTESQAMGDDWSRTLHPDDRAGAFAEWGRAMALKREFDMEFRVRRDDGTVRHVRSIAQPVLDTDGEVTDFVGSVEDITDRQLERHALEGERQRLTAIIQGTGAGTWEWNVQTGETWLNERWAEIVGLTIDELKPTTIHTWTGLTHPDDVARSNALLQAHFCGEAKAYECEARMRHRDGHWVWVLSCGRLLTRTPDGQPERMFGTHLDITVRKIQEEELRKSEELLNRTGALAQVGGWELDIASSRVKWSEETCRIHGLPPGHQPALAEAIGFYAPEARPVIEAAIHKAACDGRDWDVELPVIQHGGQRIWVRAVGHVEFQAGKPVRLFGAFQDITLRVRHRQMLESAHERISLATESGGIGLWEWKLREGTLTWDAQMYALHGMPMGPGTEGYTLWSHRLHPDDKDRVEGEVQECLKDGGDFRSEFRVVWPDGSVHYLRGSGRVTRDTEGQALRMVGANWDVTPLRHLANQLAEQHELLHVTLQSIGDAVITTNAQSEVTWLNPSAERMTGWPSAAAQGKPVAQVFHVVHAESRQPAENPVLICLEQGRIAGTGNHTVLISRQGNEFGIEDSAAPIRNPSGDILGVVLVFHDVTEQRRLSGEMSYRATHDALTGLVNRAEFESQLSRTLEKAREEGSEHALLYIDLDQFKLVNDACGHSVGDRLLQQVAKLLKDVVRAHDTLARLGGDEFAVILEQCTVDQAGRLAQQICDRMDEFRFLHDERRFRIGASIGLVPLDSRWGGTAAAMQAADTSCYAAKEAGRNRVHVWSDSDKAILARHGEMQWAARLERALEEDSFVLYAQRIEPLAGNSSGLHAEVLIRLRDSDGSLIQPGAFLPAAERFHMAARIDRWVLQRTVQQIQHLADLNVLDTLCINLTAHSVGDRAFHRYAIDALAQAGSAVCQRICLEITETAAVTNMTDAVVFIEQARELGVRIALDDFGAGASSFGYLKKLKVDLLKIDGSFIRDVIDDPLDAAAVRSFVDVARVLGVGTVAEFVEQAAVLQHVRDIGVDYAQGFLLHRPEPIENLFCKPGPGTSIADDATPSGALR